MEHAGSVPEKNGDVVSLRKWQAGSARYESNSGTEGRDALENASWSEDFLDLYDEIIGHMENAAIDRATIEEGLLKINGVFHQIRKASDALGVPVELDMIAKIMDLNERKRIWDIQHGESVSGQV